MIEKEVKITISAETVNYRHSFLFFSKYLTKNDFGANFVLKIGRGMGIRSNENKVERQLADSYLML